MSFEALQNQLIEDVRRRIQNGEFTERSLARIAGISQPHINNALKGVRNFSGRTADKLLRALRISVMDLIEPAVHERAAPFSRDDTVREVPVLEGRIGPGRPIPMRLERTKFYPFPVPLISGLVRPRAAWLTADPKMSGIIQENDLILLDRSESKRLRCGPDGLYMVTREGQALIRRVQVKGRRLYLIAEDSLHSPADWDAVGVSGRGLLDVVKAKVVWIGRNMDSGAVEFSLPR